MSNLSPTESEQLAKLTLAVDRLASLDIGGNEERMERRLGERIGRLEDKIDQALGLISDISVLKSKSHSAETKIQDLEKANSSLGLQIESLKTWRSILSTILAVVVAPLSLWAITQLAEKVIP